MWTSSATTAGSSSDPSGTVVRHPPVRTALPRRLAVLLVILLALGLSGLLLPADAAPRSSPAKGVYHLVRKGETLSRIAQAYGVSAETIRRANRLTSRDHVETGRALFIPGAKSVIDDTRPAKRKAAAPPSAATAGKKTERQKSTAAARARPSADRKVRVKPADPGSGTGKPETSGKPSPPAARKGIPAAEPVAPAGRITIVEGRVFFSEADRETAEKAAAEAAARARTGTSPAGTASPEAGKAAPSGTVREPRTTEGPEAPAKPSRPGEAATASPEPSKKDAAEERAEKGTRRKLLWPVKGRVVARFGLQPNGMYMNGVRIAAREGTPVLAADRGTVIFSAPLKDYGETVIVRHDNAYATVYTNLGSRLVNSDETVGAGARIGLVGRDGRTSSGALHFEVRVKNKACNPLLFLN